MAIIECLLAAGANHLQPDRDGNTPLHAACMKGNMSIILLLVHRYNSRDHNIRNTSGQQQSPPSSPQHTNNTHTHTHTLTHTHSPSPLPACFPLMYECTLTPSPPHPPTHIPSSRSQGHGVDYVNPLLPSPSHTLKKPGLKAAELIEDEETKTQVIFEMVDMFMKKGHQMHKDEV